MQPSAASVLSSAFPVKCHNTCASIPGDVVMWTPCLVCLQVLLPAVREPVPAGLLFSDFQTVVVNAALDWTSKGLTVRGRHKSVTSQQTKLGLSFRRFWPLNALRSLDERCSGSVKYCNQRSDNGFFTCSFVNSFILCKVNCSMCLQAILI